VLRVAERPPRVLLVEDNPVNQMVARRMLQQMGCEVTAAENGLEAVAKAREDVFDAIIMDCQLPQMDGYQATAEIRAEETSRVPVIALTAHAIGGERERCLAAGMDDYLSKPLRREALLAALQRWLPADAGAGAMAVESDALDPAMIAQLWSLDAGRPGFFRELVGSFAAACNEVIAALPAQIERQDGAEVAALAHRLKGTAANLGATSLSDAGARLERAAREERWTTAEPLLAEITALAARAVEQLQGVVRTSE
jgi:CheY-like chemotaxis protein/HPt (histidine-containing phosphotransfer) domain-containing protein